MPGAEQRTMVDTGLCACGSGLRSVRCCALDTASLPPPGADRHIAPLVERAVRARQAGADAAAEQI